VEGYDFLVLAAKGMKRNAETVPTNLTGRHIEVVEQLIKAAGAQDRPDDVKKWEAELVRLKNGCD